MRLILEPVSLHSDSEMIKVRYNLKPQSNVVHHGEDYMASFKIFVLCSCFKISLQLNISMKILSLA